MNCPLGVDEETRRVARTHAPDLYFSALLAPPRVRADLIAIAAFSGDADRIVLTVGEPPLAEIRLQWWHDALAGGAAHEHRSGNPVADAVVAAIGRHRLPLELFHGLLDARTRDLYADPLPDEAALSAYCQDVQGATFGLAARVLEVPSEAQSLVAPAAESYGRARILCRVAALLSRGRPPFPGPLPAGEREVGAMMDERRAEVRAMIEGTRRAWREAPSAARLACLPLALTGAYLSATEQHGHDPRRALADITQLERLWQLWRARWMGNLLSMPQWRT